MIDDITRDVLAVSAHGGEVGFYTWDAAEFAEQMAALRKAAYRRRFVVLEWGGNHGRSFARLAPMASAPVRCCSGTRGRGGKKARAIRRRVEAAMQAYVYRDRIAKVIGWNAAVKDATFNALVDVAMRRRAPR